MDRGYEGDSGYLAHLGSAAGTDRWDPGPVDRGAADPGALDHGGEDPAAGITRRLQARLDQHIRLLERLQAAQLYPEPPGLPELRDTAERMRRDTESLLLLAGQEPGVRTGGPRPLGDVVADAADLAEEPRRVDVRPAPEALVAPAAAVEVAHVLAELVDHVTAVYPGARVELVGHLDPHSLHGRGATVDAVVEGALRHDPDGLGGARAAAAAERIARSSRHGIALRRPPGGPPATGTGVVASVYCPAAAVTVPEPPPQPPPPPPRPPAPEPRVASGPRLPSLPSFEHGFEAVLDSGPGNGNGNGHGSNGNGTSGTNGTNGSSNGSSAPPLSFDDAPAYSPSSSSQVDELFGPLLDLPLEPIDDRYATPIFEAIASAWFREDEQGSGGSGPLDWDTPQDDEWREAAARAARSEPEPPTTSSGLPRRLPGNQLVPPPRSTERNGQGGVAPVNPPAERAPDRVRDRLSTYQRGLREGRHRATGSENGTEPEDW